MEHACQKNAIGLIVWRLLNNYLPENAVVVAVVDPGVGGSRKAICLNIGDRWYLGPDN
ncbi:SAM-dependent chlorinase/fluorinase, partial [Thiolapillus sp.]|uniref:SAM-dependent chlorinase/fluorinase n=1 Tax=Thiolapillus sp. TaxID=2017437 RepID=UPI003AF6CAC9